MLRAEGTYAMPVFFPGLHGEKRTYLQGGAPSVVYGGIRTGSHGSHDWKRTGDGQAFAVEMAEPARFRAGADWKVNDARGDLVVEVAGRKLVGAVRQGQPHWLGTLEIPAGRHEIRVRLSEVPEGGRPVIEQFLGLVLERVDHAPAGG